MQYQSLKQKSRLYKWIIISNISSLLTVSMSPSDPRGLLDDSFHALSSRYFVKDMPDFIFTFSVINIRSII